MIDDSKLMCAWTLGDANAGEALIERHYDAIVRFFRTKTQVGADDLVQRTFLVCAEKLATFSGNASFRAFLFGIARNVLFEHLRAKLRDGRPDSALGASAIVDLAPGVSTVAFRRAEQRMLVGALQQLPLELQLVIELYYWEELSIDELALVLEVPAGTVKSRLHRARTLLRDNMDRVPVPAGTMQSARVMLDAWVGQLRSQRPEPSDDDDSTP